jgi:serine/threonine protein kinase
MRVLLHSRDVSVYRLQLMALQQGTRLGAYEIVSSLEAGGMGEPYRARDTKLQRDVTLKVLPDTMARDAQRVALFDDKARVLLSSAMTT